MKMQIDPERAALARDPDAVQRIIEQARAERARHLARLLTAGGRALRQGLARLLEGRGPLVGGHGRAAA
ncbi:hypothetical protein [Inmirania thermothiophila]|uniref:Uncharacterized protein n=1 Tax=Inmirania thermothiophila TaxID=1750597 RepID=A0A3N1Y6M0_9GAMM|nr:hypothetical protein [Inmirania thermothiophila]ROR34425.1 hypothetical protein EDC57_0322 [Inmirania thermothiophila]